MPLTPPSTSSLGNAFPQTAAVWPGNSAKARIASAIMTLAAQRPLTVLDFGAGRGGSWPMILRQCPNIRLFAYEPDPVAAADLARCLTGLNAEVRSGDASALSVEADVVVSFSVFEHVYDRRAYLKTAARALKPDGVFFLNYDDGHFRNVIDLGEPRGWLSAIRTRLHNLLAPLMPKIGRIGLYQRRQPKDDLMNLLHEAGLKITSERYENLSAFKKLAKTLPAEQIPAFMAFWVATEDTLNREFKAEGAAYCGNRTNLWRIAASLTLELRHR